LARDAVEIERHGAGGSFASLSTTCALARTSLLVAARHLALDALDEEVDAAEELVVGVRSASEPLLAVVARDRPLPDHERAVLQAGLDGLDLGLDVRRHLVGNRDDVDRAFLYAPPHAVIALPHCDERG